MIVDNISDLTEILRKLSFECHEQWREEFEFVLADAADTIESLHKKQSVNEWIPCKERLPEENQNVIACLAHGTVTELAFYNGKFHGIYSYDAKIIIAWQPLPEPYKE